MEPAILGPIPGKNVSSPGILSIQKRANSHSIQSLVLLKTRIFSPWFVEEWGKDGVTTTLLRARIDIKTRKDRLAKGKNQHRREIEVVG